MKILVCIKQVPDMESRSGSMTAETGFPMPMLLTGSMSMISTPLSRRCNWGRLGDGTELTVLSIGPDRVVEPSKKRWPWAVIGVCTSRIPMRTRKTSGRSPR